MIAMSQNEKDTIRNEVRIRYAGIAKTSSSCCGGSSCCSPCPIAAEEVSADLGYSKDELAAAPDGSNMGLGCGNPQAIAALKEGEVVLDLGSGGGFDCFLAAKKAEQTRAGHRGGHDPGDGEQSQGKYTQGQVR